MRPKFELARPRAAEHLTNSAAGSVPESRRRVLLLKSARKEDAMVRLVVALASRVLKARQLNACDPFAHCFFTDPSCIPDHISGCCPSDCVCC